MSPAQLAVRRKAVAVEIERRKRRKAGAAEMTANFGEWITEARPKVDGKPAVWDAPHFVAMQEKLDRVTAGELRRVYFQVPIRHGKTEHNTVGYAAYRLERDPKTRIIVTSHNDRKARKFSRKIRKLAIARGVEMSSEVAGSGEWDTAAGGGVVALGAGAGSAGENADLIIIDDPIGSRDEAESPAHRNRIWDWLSSDILGRTEPHTAVIFTMSRWHADDPAGRLIDRFGALWTILDLPGEAEPNDPLGRAVGEPLWPALRGLAWLNEKRIELLEYGFASLIQGRPRPREGGMFKWDWWKKTTDHPATGPMVRYWDMAGTKAKNGSHDPDYTAGTLMCRLPTQQAVLVHQVAFRVAVAARDAMIEKQARADLAKYGRRVIYWLEQQAGISGEEATDSLVRRVQALGLACYAETVTGSKIERATPLASAALAGNVFLGPEDTAEPWHDAFRLEAADFPFGRHDDRVDATSGAFNKLDFAASRTAETFTNPFG